MFYERRYSLVFEALFVISSKTDLAPPADSEPALPNPVVWGEKIQAAAFAKTISCVAPDPAASTNDR